MNVIIRKIKPGKHGVMGDGFGEKTPFVQRNVSRKEQPQQGNSQCKHPVVCLRNNKGVGALE